VLPNINFRSLVVIIVLCLALSIRMLPIVAPATSSFASVRVIDSNGSRIPYIYYRLKPNAKFASQLGLIAGRKRILEQPSFEFRILKYRPTEDVGCKLLPAALRIPAAPNSPGCPCNGQYMEPQYFDCDQGCGGSGNAYAALISRERADNSKQGLYSIELDEVAKAVRWSPVDGAVGPRTGPPMVVKLWGTDGEYLVLGRSQDPAGSAAVHWAKVSER
jgi:hypothetical protein